MNGWNFSLVDPKNGPTKTLALEPIEVDGRTGCQTIKVDGKEIGRIDPQQMMELGAFLIALASVDKHVDYDSALELLDGYENVTIPPQLERFLFLMEEQS